MIDSERIYTEVTQEIAQRYGKNFTWDIKVQLMGRTQAKSNEIALKLMDLPMTPEEYATETRRLQQEKFKHVALMPGAERLVRHLHRHGIPICVASGSAKYNYDIKVTNYQDLFGLFHHVVLGSDPEVKRCKPDPDAFLVAASRFDNPPADPENVLVFEDAVHGVAASCAAKMPVVMVPDPRMDPEHFKKATLVLKSLEEFKPEEFGLPPFDE
ncbi:Pseudouridine-5'-phosphatase [Trichoplax sp. H2]|nr:Pseudouridine-5'-phosphatase [Trichoplax sp. H2]|eukprot:RDD37535.1 Pseudouridine-5'-phosphatase [Trichoplax sp. H2]